MIAYYLIKKDGKEFKTESKAAAFEMYDCLGRHDVTIEKHFRDEYMDGTTSREYVYIGHKMTRRTLKSGEIRYRLCVEQSF